MGSLVPPLLVATLMSALYMAQLGRLGVMVPVRRLSVLVVLGLAGVCLGMAAVSSWPMSAKASVGSQA